MPESLSDESIVERVQGGDAEAFGVLVSRYEEKMLRYVRRFLFGYEDAEDIVQDVFIKAYTNIQSVDTKRKFSSWLYRVAHNESINMIKKKKKEAVPFFDPETLFPHPVATKGTDDIVHDKELKKMIDTTLQELSVKYREPLILYYIEEMSYKEISEILRIPTSTVGVRIKRAKEKLKKIYVKNK
jgi:RNA polymerase sigma-70 factor, ECF subfamily